ncbi:hypothetical protein BGX24_007924 [Mortierella sp. AD032]|nr:hypothetical protein BGX24_007924 [Mortierella sp. AD032]
MLSIRALAIVAVAAVAATVSGSPIPDSVNAPIWEGPNPPPPGSRYVGVFDGPKGFLKCYDACYKVIPYWWHKRE